MTREAPSHLRRRVVVRGALGAIFLLLSGTLLYSQLDGTLRAKRPSHLLLDRRERYLGEVSGSDDAIGYWKLPEALPQKIVVTTLETEDRHFALHRGVHFPSVIRALWQNLRSFRVVSGASTIPMQVARMQHPASRTLFAKVREALEAQLLIHQHGHDAVLRQYLIIAPYGNRCHGIVRAARLYFDKPVEDLSWLQAAYLAAFPQQPGRMSPWTQEGHRRALARARRILGQLRAREVISEEDYRDAMHTDLELQPKPARHNDTLHAVLAWSKRLPDDAEVQHATIDLDVQHVTAQSLNENLSRASHLGATNTAGLVIDLPSGDVLAYVGSANYFDEPSHGAVDYLETKRSAGSTLKPFIYGVALERGLVTPATELPDTPVEFALGNGRVYAPENITHNFLGPMLLRPALGNSRNIPALRVLSQVGVDQIVERFSRAGVRDVSFEPEAYGLALAIGAMPVTPLELATLYTSIANGGVTIPLRRFTNSAPLKGERVLGRDAAALVRNILADPEARRPGFPPGPPLDFDYAVAIKTGTSQGYRDAWTAAFSDRLLVVTWVGNHDWRRMNLASGATVAAPAAHQILDAVMPTRNPSQAVAVSFPPPLQAVTREICTLSGRLVGSGCAHSKTEAFLPGTEPVETCPFHVEVALDRRNGLRAGPTCPSSVVTTQSMLVLPEIYEGWARQGHLAIAPVATSPLCAPSGPIERKVVIREPRTRTRFLFDPDTPRELSTVRLSAAVSPANAEVIWLVDGAPIARVGYPHSLHWPLSVGTHTIRAAVADSAEVSAPIVVTVDD